MDEDGKEGDDSAIHRLRRLKVACSSGSGVHLVLRQTQTSPGYRLVLAQRRPGFPVPWFVILPLNPVPPSLEGIGRGGNSTPSLTRIQPSEGYIHSGLVKTGYGSQDAFTGIGGFAA